MLDNLCFYRTQILQDNLKQQTQIEMKYVRKFKFHFALANKQEMGFETEYCWQDKKYGSGQYFEKLERAQRSATILITRPLPWSTLLSLETTLNFFSPVRFREIIIYAQILYLGQLMDELLCTSSTYKF